jgi:oligosaccharide repeat unit polymerase
MDSEAQGSKGRFAHGPLMQMDIRHPSSEALQRILRRLILATILGCGVFTTLWYDRPDLLVMGILLSFVPFILLRAKRGNLSIDFFSPEVGFPLVYVAYMFSTTIDLPVVSQFNIAIPWTQWIYYSVGLAAYLVGAASIRATSPPCIPVTGPQFWNLSGFKVSVLLLVAMGFMGRLVKVAQYGFPLFHPEEEELRVKYAGGYMGTLTLAFEAAFLCLVLFLIVCRPSWKKRTFIILLMLLLVFDSLTGDSRGCIMRIFIASLVIIHYVYSRLRLRSLIAFALVAVILVSGFGTYRDMSVFGDVHVQGLEDKGFTSYTFWLANIYESLRVTTESFYMLTRHVPAHASYTYGTTSLASLAIPFPGHQPGPGELIKKELNMDFIGFGAATTILGPLYLDGGWIAIALGMMLWGMLAKWLYVRMLGASSFFWVLTYAYFAQNQFKAIKDDMFPELGPLFVVLYFALVHFIASGKWRDYLHGALRCYEARPRQA